MSIPEGRSSAPKLPWLQTLHIVGSVASITGLSLLTLDKALTAISIGDLVGWFLAVPLLLAAATSMSQLVLSISDPLIVKVGQNWFRILLLVAFPCFVIVELFLFQALRVLFVPFVAVLIRGE